MNTTTKKAQHTGGEWYQDSLGTDKDHVIFCKGHFAIARTIKIGIPKEEVEANARLIASAPLMLKALEAVLNMGDEYESEKLVREAIKQARGE
jgi:hypothetical protein